MKQRFLLSLTFSLFISFAYAQQRQALSTGYPITPVAFTSVKVTDGFWGQRLQASREVTVPLAFSKCEATGRYKNFENAAAHLKDTTQVFPIAEGTFSFDDTDPYKTIEGASYLLQTYPDKHLRHYIDSVIDIIGAAQEPDGYLYTARIQNPRNPHPWAGTRRWEKEEDLSHELYNLGHMVESAIAHYQATGSRKFLDIAIRYADCVCREVGPAPGQACVVPGHQIAEMALAKLYLVTGDKRYLDEAKFLLDYRGKTTIVHDYSQAHRPVIEQDEAVGHAVRAAYMYAGMADVAALTGDSAYIRAIDAIWENIVSKKLYITGGIGATSAGEAFGARALDEEVPGGGEVSAGQADLGKGHFVQAESAPAALAVEVGVLILVGVVGFVAVTELILHGAAAVLDGVDDVVVVHEGKGAEDGTAIGGHHALLQVLQGDGVTGAGDGEVNEDTHRRGLYALRLQGHRRLLFPR